ncbi:MAG: tetratricopeptide repeat protein [Bacteroidia bacterium]
MASNSSSANRGNGAMLRWIVLGVGLLSCILLFFADKTNLNTLNGTELQAPTETTATANTAEADLPPLAPDPTLDEWRSAVATASGSDQIVLFDSIINRLELRGRYDFAAQYGSQLADIQRSLPNLIRAGRMYQQAYRLDHIASDSVLFRSYSDNSIRLLEAAKEMEPENEDAQYYLGLAYVESKKQENSMKGILAIRDVLKINPDNLNATFSLGVFSVQTGQYDKAEARFEKVLNLQPDNYEAMYYLAYARAQQNIPGNSKELLEQVIARSDNSDLKQKARTLLNNL